MDKKTEILRIKQWLKGRNYQACTRFINNAERACALTGRVGQNSAVLMMFLTRKRLGYNTSMGDLSMVRTGDYPDNPYKGVITNLTARISDLRNAGINIELVSDTFIDGQRHTEYEFVGEIQRA